MVKAASAFSTTAPYKVIPIKSWADYKNIVTGGDFESWVFRGHSDARWKLYSKLSRRLIDYKINQLNWYEQEQRIIRIFKRKAHHYLAHLPNQKDVFSWLALMQHHEFEHGSWI